MVELSFNFKENKDFTADILAEILHNAGISFLDIIQYKSDFTSKILIYFRSALKARHFRRKIAGLKIKGVVTQIKRISPRDWQNRFKREFRTFQLTQKLDIVPLGEKKRYHPSFRQPIFLERIDAFGTGLHETTLFMARFIEYYEGHFLNFLDVGTGTGILSLVALKSGAREVSAIDIDKNCVAAARENLRLNNHVFKNIKVVDINCFVPSKKFDFVAANLLTVDLIKAKRKLISLVKKGKFLAVSGISLENFKIFNKVFKKLPLRCLKVMKGKEWAAVLYQKL